MVDNGLVLSINRLQLIERLIERINRGRRLEEVFDSLFTELHGLIPYDRLSLGFLVEDGKVLQAGLTRSNGPTLLDTGYSEPIEGSSLKALLEGQDVRIIDDLEGYLAQKPSSKSTRLIVDEGMMSSLTVPLVADGRYVGFMWFSSRQKGIYSEQHAGFLKTIAGHLAVMIEKGRLTSRLEEDNRALEEANRLKTHFVERLEEEVERQVQALRLARRKQDVLLEIARSMHATLDLGQVFRTLVTSLRPILSFERASILMLSEADRTLRFRELDPPDREILGRGSVIPVEGSAAGQAIRDARPLYTRDLEGGSSFYEDSLLRRAGIRSRVCVPLFVQRRPIGTLNLSSRAASRYSDEDLDFLVQLSEQISVAVANSEAYREIDELKDRLQHENLHLKEVISHSSPLSDLVGESPPWKKVLRQIEMVAPMDTTVLIRGETGTGKEMVARALHRLSARKDRPFVAINCAALTPEIIASELFGHEKGAFTGAIQQKTGRLELAEGGTLFLDEIAELPPDMQVKLLRVLQEHEFERVGGNRPIRVDVRVIAATNRDLERARAAGRFRDDLFFRLNVFPIPLPPLRERKEDLEPLISCFLRRYAQKIDKKFDQVDRASLQRCLDYSWPGNVRELENLVERSVILCPGPVLTMDPSREADALSGAPVPPATLRDTVRARLVDALRASKGKIYGPGGAAEFLGLKPSTLQAKMKRFGLDRREF
jgi:formate hydrogenlyase transcriptional activator